MERGRRRGGLTGGKPLRKPLPELGDPHTGCSGLQEGLALALKGLPRGLPHT